MFSLYLFFLSNNFFRMETVLSTPELLFHIFTFLDFTTIKMCRTVSRFWKQQSEYYKFWENVQLIMDECKKVEQVSDELLNIVSNVTICDRKKIYSSWIKRITPREENKNIALFNLYEKLSTCSRLKNISLRHITHDTKDFSKLLSIIPHLNRMNLHWCHLSSYQLTSVYQQITNLEMLTVNDDLRHVPADLLALTLTKVKRVKLEYANLSSEQLTLIYQEISSSSNCKLKYLKIDLSNHTNVESKLIISAFSKLKQVNIETCRIEFEQLMDILFAIDRGEIKSEYVCLYTYFENILHLPSDLILRLEKGPVALELKWIGMWGLVHYKRFYKVFNEQFYRHKLNRGPFHFDFMEGTSFYFS